MRIIDSISFEETAVGEAVPVVPEGEAEQPREAAVSQDLIRPEIKEAIDAYEKFMDSYIEFMQNYDSNDISALVRYFEMLEEYSKSMEEFESLEDDDLTQAELLYYLEVESRVANKLMAVSD